MFANDNYIEETKYVGHKILYYLVEIGMNDHPTWSRTHHGWMQTKSWVNQILNDCMTTIDTLWKIK